MSLEQEDLLCYCMGEKAEMINSFGLSENDLDNFYKVITTFQNYFIPKTNYLI